LADPAYITTAVCMVQAAYVLMAERDKLPHGSVICYVILAFCIICCHSARSVIGIACSVVCGDVEQDLCNGMSYTLFF